MAWLTVLLLGCATEREPDPLQDSLQDFLALEDADAGDYEYEIDVTLSRMLANPVTTITVRSGQVVARAYEATGATSGDTSWVEDETTLGDHDEGAAPVAFEHLYTECEEQVVPLAESEGREIEIVYDPETGVLASCTARDPGCVDDCSVGFDVRDLRFGR